MSGFIRELRMIWDRVDDSSVYPWSIPALSTLDVLPLNPGVTFFIGENGSGKSTLIEALAIGCGFNAEGGSKNFNFSTRASESPLHETLRIVRTGQREKTGFFLRAESLFNVATEVEESQLMQYGWVSLHERSHGEAFLWLLNNRFGGNGLYIMDEPEAALSPQRQLAMLVALNSLVQQGSQIIIATHSPILMAFPGATIYQLDENGVAPIAYRQTEHYRVTHDFLADPERMLHLLLSEDE
ncbi:MAG: putative ATPase [Myxococcota bacterium]